GCKSVSVGQSRRFTLTTLFNAGVHEQHYAQETSRACADKRRQGVTRPDRLGGISPNAGITERDWQQINRLNRTSGNASISRRGNWPCLRFANPPSGDTSITGGSTPITRFPSARIAIRDTCSF